MHSFAEYMSPEVVVAAIAAVISFFSAVYARKQAKIAKEQAAIAEAQLREAREANRQAQIANQLNNEQLSLIKEEREEKQRVLFRFQPRRSDYKNYLDLVNDAPFDTYVVWVQLAGPKVQSDLNGKRIHSPEKIGGESFMKARSTVQILDETIFSDFSNSEVVGRNSTAQFTLLLKTDGKMYEVRTDVTLDIERGFSTHGTTITLQ